MENILPLFFNWETLRHDPSGWGWREVGGGGEERMMVAARGLVGSGSITGGLREVCTVAVGEGVP
jgi:hypothetical protein